MPGVIMEHASVDISSRHSNLNEQTNGAPSHDKNGRLPMSTNGPVHGNGMGSDTTTCNQSGKPTIESAVVPFELPHITQGFFLFSTLLNRAVQQCWNDLSELVTELAAVHVSNESSAIQNSNGKFPGNQSAENVHKKVRILDFAQAKRAEFIKLLVLSQWGRQAAEVSRLIDIQGFIRTRHQAYMSAVQFVGEMKRDLVRAQMANPDLKTALEVLSKGSVATLTHLGYKPPRPLTARATLKKLHKINRIIGVRLALHDQVPFPLRNYRVHDGRVTFIVHDEFELDLSVAEEASTSQFFFVDIRFLFSPSSPIPKGKVFNELDARINQILHSDGLIGCFDFLHGLVLTNKINILFKQAVDLARSLWSGALRIEFLHRTLVLQYWIARAGPKSWLEIGVQRGRRNNELHGTAYAVPRIGLRWIRDGQQANGSDIQFDASDLSMERVMRSVIALHTSHLLFTAYTSLKKSILFSDHVLSLRAQLSLTEPGDCFLGVQLTPSRSLRVSIEPSSGSITLSGVPGISERHEPERASNKSAIEELLARVARVRCATAIDEIEFGIKALGLESVGPRGLGLDPRRLFPANTMRSAFFTHSLWDRGWVAAVTSSMDGDSWWLVQVRFTEPRNASVHLVRNTLMSSQRRFDYSACAEFLHGLTGMLAICSNGQFLADLPDAPSFPPLEKMQLGSDFQVPDLFVHYKPAALPPALRISLPAGSERASYLEDTIRLSFHGIDRQSQSAVLMAYGTFRYRIKVLPTLVSQMDPLLVMQDKGCGFAFRLLVPAGHSIIVGLFERLQRFDCVLSILQSLIQRNMTPQSLSLSHLAFTYGSDKQFGARFDINVSGPTLADHVENSRALYSSDPLFSLQLRISFDNPSPHRRIQQALTVVLNQRFTETGVNSVLGFMSDTFPLLQCLDRITKSTPTESSIVHVVVRSPTVFQFHYPQLSRRYRLSARPRKGRMLWLLENSSQSEPSEKSHSASITRERIYKSKGDGWQGLGDGAIASLEKIGNLLSELHSCLSTCTPEPNQQKLATTGQKPITSEQSKQNAPSGAVKLEAIPLQKPDTLGKADVITID
ncbi:Mediator complex subunit Med14 [Penicillium angulare]|uniref:Mediator complex subunit Med14 n=1 Tax=Penicillium angulare TaxID=116970 RepID=UPI002540871A|nr:Mediator complex subunit Med14 [Penicillium angulare]KAJ5291145.1 Mediator complex subunit Med14 [Penicillium angulare]